METKVLTPKGFKLLGDIKVGDQINNPDGTLSRVIQVHERGQQQFYRVTLSDGSTVEASEDHLWAASIVGGRRRRKHAVPDVPDGLRAEDEWNLRLAQRYTVMTTKEMARVVAESAAGTKKSQTQRHVLLPLTAPVVMTAAPGRWPALPPYTLGALIGDGHLGKEAVTLTCADEGIAQTVQSELGDSLRVLPVAKRGAATAYRISSTPGDRVGSAQVLLRRDGLLGCRSYEKFVPERIKRATVETRFAFLRGLFDTDGHMSLKGRIELSTVSERLATDVQFLLRSLGFKAKISSRYPTFTHKGEKKQGRLAYRISVRGPHHERLFGLARKVEQARESKQGGKWHGHRVVSVVPSGIDNARCITVDHPNSLYITDDFIVTHNSHWMLSQIGADDCMRHPGLKCLMLRKVGSSGRESFEDLLPKTIGKLGEWVPSQSTFRFANGSRIKLGHFKDERDVDKYLGLEYDVIGIEEDTQISSRKRQTIRSCCRSAVGSGWRARTYSTTNPGGVGHSAYRKRFIEPYRSGAETETRFIPATVDDNSFAPREYVQFLDGLTGWLKRAWRFGDWDIAAGQFFTTWKRAAHVVATADVRPDWKVWLSLDYGFTHYTAAYLFAQSHDGDVFIVDEHAERRWLVERHAAALDAMLARHGIAPHRLVGRFAGSDVFAKKQDGGTIADDYKAHGHPLKAANMDRINGAAEILRRLGDPERGQRPTLFIHERCARLIECLPALEHDPHRPEDVLKVDTDDDGVGGDDYYDSARYGCMAAARPIALRRGPSPTARHRG